MSGIQTNSEISVDSNSNDVVYRGSRPGQLSALAMPAPMLVPTRPSEEEMAYEKSLAALLEKMHSRSSEVTIPTPTAVTVNTTNSASMSVFSPVPSPILGQHDTLIPVPLRLIPLLLTKITDRHLRETYRYYKWFVNKETRAAISEWPEGVSEKLQWKERMVDVGRDIRFLGRKQYQNAVEEAIRTKGLTMKCGQTPTSWSDCLAALFNPDQYNGSRRELVYWIQFGLLKESNNSWIQKLESDWCASTYGIRIVYDKSWEGNYGHCSIDNAVHGESFLPFVRARGSWFKWFFLKGANEIREVIQGYSLRTHGIYERICVSKHKRAEHHMTYTKCTFAHGVGYICESIDKRRKQEIQSPETQPFTMETVTAWLEQRGKSVNDKPSTLFLTQMVNSEMSSLTQSVTDRNTPASTSEEHTRKNIRDTNMVGVLDQGGDRFDSNILMGNQITNSRDHGRGLRSEMGRETINVQHAGENMEMVSDEMSLLYDR
jgi:hypothetical protein